MNSNFLRAVANRRTMYSISNVSTISDENIKEILEAAIKNAPSAFNSQSSRVVLLKDAEHRAMWDMVLEAIKAHVPADAFEKSKEKVDNCFACGYGTIMFFEDQDTVADLQEKFPSYAPQFAQWSEHHSGILQFIVWTALEEAGMGASLQHYAPLIEEKVKARWNLPKNWKLIAQMPFGRPTALPGEKEFMPLEKRLSIFG